MDDDLNALSRDELAALLGHEHVFHVLGKGRPPASFAALTGGFIGGTVKKIRRYQAGIRLAPALHVNVGDGGRVGLGSAANGEGGHASV